MRLAFCLAALATAAITGLATAVTATAVTATAALASPGPAAGLSGAATVKAGPGAQPPGGTQLWAARYDAPAKSDLHAAALVVSPDDSVVFVTGSASSAATPGQHVVTVAYNAVTGARVWVARYYGLGMSRATSVAVSPDGSKVFVTGGTAVPSTSGGGYATVAYNAATGATLWVRRYGSSADNGEAHSVVVSPDGSKVFVTGGIGPLSAGTSSLATVAYDASTGSTLWAQRYTGPGTAGTYATSAAVSPDGSALFVTGTTAYTDGTSQFATLAYATATGAMRWAAPYDVPGIAESAVVSPNGTHVYVTGSAEVAAYDATTGASQWMAPYGAASHTRLAASVAVSPDGSAVFVTGLHGTHIADTDAYTTVAYNAATGATLWVQHLLGTSGFTGANSIAVSPDGTKVFVTGGEEAANGTTRYATVAYNAATGTGIWVRKYSGPASSPDSVAASVKVSPDGSKVFVTGYSAGPDAHFDYATVAYSP
jgi:outer membrane protein assembly factor BamB